MFPTVMTSGRLLEGQGVTPFPIISGSVSMIVKQQCKAKMFEIVRFRATKDGDSHSLNWPPQNFAKCLPL